MARITKQRWREGVADEVAQWVMCLPHKHEDKTSDTHNSYNKAGRDAGPAVIPEQNKRKGIPRASWLARSVKLVILLQYLWWRVVKEVIQLQP